MLRPATSSLAACPGEGSGVPTADLSALRSPAWWLPLIALAVLYLRYLLWLSVEWGINANYGFGGMVPIAVAVLFYLRIDRWRTPAAPSSVVWHVAIVAVLSLGFLPFALVGEVNPDWRLLMWGEAGLLALTTLVVLHALGGWPWVRAALPLLILLSLAIPWPTRVEQWLLNLLLESVSTRAADLFHLFGHNVVQHSNLIYVDGVALGVDEACSGIKSFQLTLVVVVFLCLWRPLSPVRTFILAMGGLLACLTGNLIRILLLGLIGVRKGDEALATWHDPVGTAATLFILLMIMVLRWLVQPDAAHSEVPTSRFRRFEADQAKLQRRISGWRPWQSALLLVLVLLPPVAAHCYYGNAGNGIGEPYRLSFDWEAGLPGFEWLPIPDSVTEQMRYTEARRFSTAASPHWSLQGYAFYWEDGRISSFTAVHRPENCLPSIGYRMVAALRPLALPVADTVLPIHRYSFEMAGRQFFVYHAFWDTSRGEDALQNVSTSDRLRPVWNRERFGPRQAFLFMVAGELPPAGADQLVMAVVRAARAKAEG